MSKTGMTKLHQDESGIGYVMILLILVLLSSLSLAFLQKVGTEISATMNRGKNMQAHYLAESAANHALWRLLNEPSFPASETTYYMHTLGQGRYGYKVRRHTDTTFATIATVGAIGESVAKQGYVLHVKRDCDGIFADDFETDDYSGSTGTLPWASDWVEINEDGNPQNGDEIVSTDEGDLSVRVQDNDGGGEGVERAVNLSAYASATLSFEYRRDKLDNTGDYVNIEISSSGGPWTELDRFEGPATDLAYTSVSYDITPFISADTRIRFVSSPNLGGQDRVWFDNVDICAKN